MNGRPNKKLSPLIRLIRFECKITPKEGGKKFTHIDLPPVIKKGGKVLYKDESGNTFEYFAIKYKNKDFNPNINFGLFNEDEKKFADNFKYAYWIIFAKINDEVEDEKDLEFVNKFLKTQEENELLKEQLKRMKVKHKIYFKEYDEIYNGNLQGMDNLTKEESQFIKSNGYRKITRYTAFLILLYRHKNDTDFLLKVDLKDEDSIKNLYDNFYNAYRQ